MYVISLLLSYSVKDFSQTLVYREVFRFILLQTLSKRLRKLHLQRIFRVGHNQLLRSMT